MTPDKQKAPSMTWGLTWLIPILFFTAGVLCPDVSAGPLYRWVDEKGVTHVTDSPPESPAGQEQVTEITPEAAGRPRGNVDASYSKEFVARSSQWLKDPSLISDTVITIRPVKDKTYWLAMQNRGRESEREGARPGQLREVGPRSEARPHDGTPAVRVDEGQAETGLRSGGPERAAAVIVRTCPIFAS